MSEVVARFSLENNPLNARYTLSDGSEVDAIFKIDAAGTVWGTIDGTLSNQTDLQAALDLKADKTELDADIAEVNTTISNLETVVNNNYTTLDNKIDGVESDLSGDISALSQTVEDNNTAVNNRIDETNDTVSDLSDTVTSNYNTLDGKIDSEISSRTLADTTLQNNIDAEVLARQNADTTLQGNVDTLSGTVTSNYNILDGKITTNSDNITSLQNTINTYGDIVTYDAADFATSTQGALADSALQPNDNISELVNDVGYITSASLPTDYVPNTRTINGYALSSNITLNYSDVGALSSSTTINDLTTATQQAALNSGATTTNIGQITTNENNISDIQDLIPNQATTSNQLADKDFVNSSIATNTAYFIGTFNSVAELEAYSGTLTNNDYAFVATTDAAGNTLYDRYKYNADTQEWMFEYELNNSSFTAAQWDSINSGATSTNIDQIATNASDISDLQTNKQDVLTAGANIQINNNVISATDTTYTAGTGISIVNGVISNTQTSAEWGNIQGTLSNQTDLQTALDAKQNTISDLSTIRSGAALGATALQPNDNITELVNNAGYITGITSSDVTTALGYTPYNATNPNNYITASALTGYATENWVTNQGYLTGITSSDVTTALGYTPLSNATKYGSSLTYSSNALQLLDQDGNALGSSVTIQSSPDIDNKSITENSNDELQTVGVIDQNNTSNAIKTWTGTKAQYDAIVTKDSNTLYNIIDDTDVTFQLLELIYPIGSIYIGTMSTCPLQVLGLGTWQLVASDRVLQGAGTRGSVGDTLNESLPNITGEFGALNNTNVQPTGCFDYGTTSTRNQAGATAIPANGITIDASRSSSTYQDNAPVQQDAYLVNIWERIS